MAHTSRFVKCLVALCLSATLLAGPVQASGPLQVTGPESAPDGAAPTICARPCWVQALAVDPRTHTTVYAGTSSGVYKTVDGGGNWSKANTGLYDGPYALAIDPAHPSTIYASWLGGSGGEVYKSTDAAGHWSYAGTLGENTIFSLAIDPRSTNVIYALDGFAGVVYKTTDGGSHWSLANTGLPATSISNLAIDPSAPAILYATTLVGVYRSTDAAAHWSAAGLAGTDVRALAIDPKTPANVYVGSESGGIVYKTTDRGEHWTRVGGTLPPGEIKTLIVDPAVPSTLYAGTSGIYSANGTGIFKSTTGGSQWSQVNAGLTGLWTDTLVIDPVTPGTLYATSNYGIVKTTDGGLHWTTANNGLLELSTLQVTPASVNFELDPGQPAHTVPLIITNSASALPINWSAFLLSDGPRGRPAWVALSTDSGTTPGTLGVTLYPSAAAYGKNQDTVIIRSQDRDTTNGGCLNYECMITVTLNVPTPALSVTPPTAQFDLAYGQSAGQELQLTNTGSPAAINWMATTGAPWLHVAPSSGVTPGTLRLTAVATDAAVGSHTAQLHLAANDGFNKWGQALDVPVTITVPDPGLLVPATLGLWHVAGGPPVTQTITIGRPAGTPPQAWLATAVPNTGAVQLADRLRNGSLRIGADGRAWSDGSQVAPASWLALSPDAGTAPGMLAVSAREAGLAPGVYQAAILIVPTNPDRPDWIRTILVEQVVSDRVIDTYAPLMAR
jgi:photosystem II stability/assembly factor-like uncharacterized protein